MDNLISGGVVMGTQNEQSTFDATVYSYETSDKVLGGVGGTANAPLLNLTNRTRWLFNQVMALINAGYTTMAAVQNYAAATFQAKLGFNPVQQGGGNGQSANKIYVGLDNTGLPQPHLRGQVDTTDIGTLALLADVTAEAQARSAAVSNEATQRDAQDQSVLAQAVSYVNSYAFSKYASYFNTAGILEIPTVQGVVYIQWGSLTLPPDDVVRQFSYPTSFPNACVSITISYGANTPPNQGAVGAQPQSAGSFLATNSASGSTAGGAGNGCYWIALGY